MKTVNYFEQVDSLISNKVFYSTQSFKNVPNDYI